MFEEDLEYTRAWVKVVGNRESDKPWLQVELQETMASLKLQEDDGRVQGARSTVDDDNLEMAATVKEEVSVVTLNLDDGLLWDRGHGRLASEPSRLRPEDD